MSGRQQGEAPMKVTDRVFAIRLAAGAIVAFLIWFAWDLPWQGLFIGILVGLILYEKMTRHADHETMLRRRDWADRKPDKQEESQPFGRPSE
jgi:uncharacterized membrane protein